MEKKKTGTRTREKETSRQEQISRFILKGALQSYEKQHDYDAGLFLANHYLNSGNSPQDEAFAFQILRQIEKESPSFEVYLYLGLCYLYGKGVEKDIDRAVDYFLLCDKQENDFITPSYLAEIYLEGLIGYQNLDRGFSYLKKALNKLMDKFHQSLTALMKSRPAGENSTKMEILGRKSMENLLENYKKIQLLKDGETDEAERLLKEISVYQPDHAALIKSILLFEGRIFPKDDEEAMKLFRYYYRNFLMDENFRNASMDVIRLPQDISGGKREVVEGNYPIHEKEYVERFIQERKVESEFKITSSMLVYGECYFGAYQDFPTDYAKAFEIFSDLYLLKPEDEKAATYLFFQYLYGLGTRKDPEKAKDIADRLALKKPIGILLQGFVLYEQHKYHPFNVKYVLYFCEKQNEAISNQFMSMLKKGNFEDVGRADLNHQIGFDPVSRSFLLDEAMMNLKNHRYKTAFRKFEKAADMGYLQGELMVAYLYYYGIGVEKSLIKYKKQMNRVIAHLIYTDKERLIEDGYLEK